MKKKGKVVYTDMNTSYKIKMQRVYTFFIYWQLMEKQELINCINSVLKIESGEREIIYVVDLNITAMEDDVVAKERETSIKECFKELKINYCKIKNEKEIIETAVKRNVNENMFFTFLDEFDRISVSWFYEMDKIEESVPLVINRLVYRKENESIFKYNLSLCEISEVDGIQDLTRHYFLSGGEDRFLTSYSNKSISYTYFRQLVKQVTTNGEKCADSLYPYVILNVKDFYFNKNCSVVYGMGKESLIYGKKDWESVIEKFDKRIKKYESYSKGIVNIKECIKEWYKTIRYRLGVYHPNNSEEIDLKIDEICHIKLESMKNEPYFESLITDFSYSYFYFESIFLAISKPECEYIGFDIFDTLIERPFWEPVDLFYLLNKKYNELVGRKTVVDFSLIRKNGEEGCRGYQLSINPLNEDVTIDQIYDYICIHYGIAREVADQLKEYEIELEKRYCLGREIGKVLYDIACYFKKKILIISDMYLPEEVLAEILHKNGFNGFKKLYVSNKMGLSKYSGTLFKYVLKDNNIKRPESMCFIGDNYLVDILKAQNFGIRTFHVPKATDIFMGINQAIKSGNFFKAIYEPNGGIIDQGTVLKFFGIRCMMAVVANKFYGNPFVEINPSSDFDADPKLVGYYCAGQFLFSEAKWLLDESSKRNIGTIHFVARDGYYVKEAYDRLKKYFNGAASDYMYLSRKAIAPLYMANKEGIYELFLPPHILNNTPYSVSKLLAKVLKDNVDIKKVLLENGIAPEKKFSSLNSFYIFAKFFTDRLFDQEKADEYAKMLKDYFEKYIAPNDVIFDVGYSGRMENALTKLLGYPVNSCYFHEHEPWAVMRKQYQEFSIDSFYSFKPCSAFVLREQIFTPMQPSCTGLEPDKDGNIVPSFAENNVKYKEELILGIIQKYGIKFVEDIISIFSEDLNQLIFNYFDACIPFEYYMHYAKPFDQKIMKAVEFEDEFGTGDTISLYDYWIKEQDTFRLRKNISIVNKSNGDMLSERNMNSDIDYDTIREQIRKEVYEQEGVFKDGCFMRLYRKFNTMFPLNSKRRQFVKRILGGRINEKD